MKRRDLESHLSKNGCVFKREGGSHSIWENKQNRSWSPIPRHKEIKEHLVKRICNQLEIAQP